MLGGDIVIDFGLGKVDKASKEKVKQAIQEVFDKVDVLSLDKEKTRELKSELGKIAKTFGTSLSLEIKNSLSNVVLKALKFDKAGKSTQYQPKRLRGIDGSLRPDDKVSRYYDNLWRTGRASVSGNKGELFAWEAKEWEIALGDDLKRFGLSVEQILTELTKQASFIATDAKTKRFTLGLNGGNGEQVTITGDTQFKNGRQHLVNPGLSTTMSAAGDLGSSAFEKIKHNNRLIETYEKMGGKEKEIADLKAENLKLEKEITETQRKKITYSQEELAIKKDLKKQNEQEKEEEKKQNEAYREALSLLNKIHQLKLDYIQNSDKANSTALLKVNEEQVSVLTEQLNAKKQLVTEGQKELLNSKEKALADERSLAFKRKELRLDSHRNSRGGLLDEAKTAMQRVATYGVAYGIINLLKQTISKSISTIIKFDKHMTNLRMVLQKTAKDTKDLKNAQQTSKKEVENLTKSYIELARELGSTSEAVIAAADLWLRQGRSLAETNELIRATMIMSNIAVIDSAQSADILTSAINGFKLEAKDAMHVVDVFASVDLAAAANTEELAEAMQRVAATAGEVGVSFENITAYIGTLVDATRIAPETIGSALNTILSRMQNIKLGAMVSDEGDSLSDAQKALNQVGIELFDVNGSFKEMDVVLGQLAAKWNELNDAEKSSIAYAVAGTRQRNVFLQLMNNWEKSVYLSTVALNSEGKALEKQEIYMDSYEASVNRLTDSWDKFLNRTNADAFKNFNNGLGQILELANSLNFSLLDLIATLAGFLTLLKGNTIADKVEAFFNFELKNTEKFIKALDKVTFKDDTISSAARAVAEMGQSFKNFKQIKAYHKGQGMIGVDPGGIFAAHKKLNKDQIARISKYQELGLSKDQALETEKMLGQATKTSRLSRVVKGIGIGIMAYQALSAIAQPIADAISQKNDATRRVELGKAEIEAIGEQIKKNSAAETKANLDMLTKVATQVSAGEISPELQSELATIIETLNENLGVNKSLLKTDENGNETLKSLEELVAEYEGEIANQSFDSFMSGRETLFADLNEQLTEKKYRGFGKITDTAGVVGNALSGAAAGAVGGAAVGGPFAWLTAIIGAVVGAAGGLLTADWTDVAGVGEVTNLEEAIRITEENYDKVLKEGDSETAAELKENLDQLKEIKAAIDEQTDALREDYSANLQMLASSIAKNAAEDKKEVAPTDIAMIQNIADVVARELTLEQMASEDTYNIFRKGIDELVKDLLGADTKASYTEIYKTFESGGYFASLLGDNTSALKQVGAIISANGPTLASAASALREELEKTNKEYERQLNAVEHRSNMLNSLATLGADSNFSKDQILSMLNIGGAVNTSGIVDPALRSYAQGLADLYEEYWGEGGKIANASYLQDQEKLGEEYARAVSLKEKEYEILKKQLEVQKSQNKLAEAQRERDTLVFRNGRFMYEANPNTLKQLGEEQEKLKKEQEQLEIQRDIQEYTKTEVDRLAEISTAMSKIIELLEGDVAANVLKIQESIGEDIQKDIADGIIDNPMYYMLYQMISGLSADYQDKLSQLELFTDEEGNFITGLTGKSPYDKGGLLQGKGLFSKQTSLDEVVLSATDAPKILSLLSKTGEFQDTVLQANTLLKSLGIKDGKISSLLTQANGGNIIYNINAVNVEEANDIEGILHSASEKVKTTNSKFIKG